MMKSAISKIFRNPVLLILLTAIIKLPLFFTKNIQEDSFITWRVARNLLQYGVIGFNGEERISASTTHLYVLISAFFQLIFGDYFIYPLLIFSGILFATGTYWLAKMLFPIDYWKRGYFVLFLNMIPPALAASGLGMEYGILFFIYNAFLFFGIFKGKKWAYIVFPILLLWTRIDTVIFLGIFFLADLVIRKKINYLFILGGILGVVSVVSFNYLYFGELVNHTITAKKIAYKNLIQNNSFSHFLYQWAYYGGLIKQYSIYTLIVFLVFLGFLGFCIQKVFKNKTQLSNKSKIILISVVVFAVVKVTIFAYFKAYFDWYYWIPRVFMFALIFYYLLQFETFKRKWVLPTTFIIVLGLYSFQLLQSYTIGYMEERQRMQIAADINESQNNGLKNSILLEPAGIIPFYTGLYTYDEVGLVNKRINDEMLKDDHFWWMNSIRRFQPDYIMTIGKEPSDNSGFYAVTPKDVIEFKTKYRLQKKYPIAKIHENAPSLLKWIYGIRPIGKDYYLYKKVN